MHTNRIESQPVGVTCGTCESRAKEGDRTMQAYLIATCGKLVDLILAECRHCDALHTVVELTTETQRILKRKTRFQTAVRVMAGEHLLNTAALGAHERAEVQANVTGSLITSNKAS